MKKNILTLSVIMVIGIISMENTSLAKEESVTLKAIIPNTTSIVADRKIVYNSYNSSTISIYNYGADLDGAPDITNSPSVTLSVTKNDYIEVTFEGNIYGNTYLWVVMSGSASITTIRSASTVVGWSAHTQIWRPYAITGFYKATSTGTVTFKQKVWNNDMNSETIKLKNITASGEIVKNIIWSS